MLFAAPQGLGDLGDSNVLALQQALVKLGKSVSVTGTMNDSTVGALWSVVKANLTKAKQLAALISSEASTALGWFVDAMNWLDAQVHKIPGGLISVETVLSNWVNITSVAGAACNLADSSICRTAVKAINDARATMHAGLTKSASVFAKIATAFGTSPSPPATTTTTTIPINKLLMAQAFDVRLVKGSAMVKTAAEPPPVAPPPVVTPASQVPAFVKQWWFWAIVGLTAGALIARRAA